MDELNVPSMNLKFFKGAKRLREIMNVHICESESSSDSQNEKSSESEESNCL